MDYTLISSVVELGGFAFLFGAGLGYAAKKFEVEVDPRAVEIEGILPGVNCGACGYPGCSGYAAAVAAGDAPVNLCSVGGADVAAKVAAVMGVEAGTTVKMVAMCLCSGGTRATDKFIYDGVSSCAQAAAVSGGQKECPFGCLGYGDCAEVCPFDAIVMDDNNIPRVDFEKCTACGMCVSACPRGIMQLVPYKKKVVVACSSMDTGKAVKSYCSVGCIGCKICEKNCPADAIKVENFLAKIDYNKCINCGICVKLCPTHSILDRTTGIALPEPANPEKTEKILAKLKAKKAAAKAKATEKKKEQA